MAVAVSTDFTELVTQYSKENVDSLSLRDAFLQLDSAQHAMAFSQMATLASLVALNKEDKDDAEHFLQYQCNRSRREALELVRVAVALTTLPCLADAFGTGALSFTQLALLTQLATPETDEQWVEDADGYSLQQLKRLAQEKKLEDDPPTERDADHRSVRFTETETRAKIRGEFPLEMLLPLKHIIDRMADSEGLDPETGLYRDIDERRADALLALAGQQITEDPDPDRATVSIHLDIEQMKSLEGTADMDGRPVLVKDIAHYLCDMRYQIIGKDGNKTVGIGDLSRDIPHWLRRLLKLRDNGCRFPSCQKTKGVDGHHIQWWSLQGPTNLDNLISLCRRHHRLIHKAGWTIHGDPNAFVTFKDKDGNAFSTGPPHLRTEIKEFVDELLQDDDPTRFGEQITMDLRDLAPKRRTTVKYQPLPEATGSWANSGAYQ